MQDVTYVDALGLPGDTREKLVAAVNAMAHAAIFVPRHDRVGEGHIYKAHALVTHLKNEALGAARIVVGDKVADGLEFGLRRRRMRTIMPCCRSSPDT